MTQSEVAAVLGLLWGSFVGVLVDRVPASVGGALMGRSRCSSCGMGLGVIDLVPVVSWLVLRGRCRNCGASIGIRPLLMEVGTAALFILAAHQASDMWQSGLLSTFLGLLLGLSAIDIEHHRLPNQIVLPAVLVAVVFIAVGGWLGGRLDPLGGALGAALFGGSLLTVAVLSRGGMGMGDVKLSALIGLVLGAVDLPSVGVAAGAAILLGGLMAIFAVLRGAGRRSALPFGPMLAAGALVAVAAGPEIAEAYMGLLR